MIREIAAVLRDQGVKTSFPSPYPNYLAPTLRLECRSLQGPHNVVEESPTMLNTRTKIAVLASGGLDSCILVGHLLAKGHPVQPLYVRAGLVWEDAERTALRRFLAQVSAPDLCELVALDLPLKDLYGDHWSVTGDNVPGADTPDEAVFLPGRNLLLIIKAALWCQLHGIPQLALAPLGTSPFADAAPEFFAAFQSVLNWTGGRRIEIVTPFTRHNKLQVMQLGAHLPLESTFSCISPIGGRHCGRCNKCAERRAAFASAGLRDATDYADTRSI